MNEQIREVANQALAAMMAERTPAAVTEAEVASPEMTELGMAAEEVKTAMLAERVKEAETEEAVKAVLMSFLKVRDMRNVYETVTESEYTGRMVGVSREEIASNMASQIMTARENERFKALSVEEKYEELKTLDDRMKKLQVCTMDELEALAEKTGVDAGKYADKPEVEKRRILEESIEDKMDIAMLEKMVSEEAGTSEIYSLLIKMSREALTEVAVSARIIGEGEYHGAWELTDKLMEYLKAEIATRTFAAVKEAVSAEEARKILKKADSHTLAEVAKMAGSDFSERIEEAKEEISDSEKLMDWAIEWILERLGFEEEGVETEMANEAEAERQPEVETEEAPAEMEEETQPEAEEEAPAEMTEPEGSTTSVKPEIAFPLEGHTAESLKNLVNTIYARGSLMSKATGGDFRVSEKLVEELKEYGTTVEEVLRIIRSAGEEWLHGLAFEEDKVVFTGFPATDDAVKTHAYILLATAINNASIEQKRIQAKKVDESNEKFAFRVWLVRLGLNGPEAKAERKTFYANLTGHTAFRTKEDEEKWYARRRAVASTSNTEGE